MSAASTAPGFEPLPDAVSRHARVMPDAAALVTVQPDGRDDLLRWAALDEQVHRGAAALQRDGLQPGEAVAICAASSNAYVVLFLATLRAGGVVAPIAPGGTPPQIAAMVADSGARLLGCDAAVHAALADELAGLPRLQLDDDAAWQGWLAAPGSRPAPVAIDPEAPFNIIYSSGTTGTPKGIVQAHAMRAAQVQRAAAAGYGPGTVTLLATPLYSNTTLVAAIPTLARGGTLVLCPKFDNAAYLAAAQRHRATHTMLVPVQYRRLLDFAGFDAADLSSFRFKACTSAPLAAETKAELLRRWPGELAEYYGLTEGGATAILYARQHPDKLHTVGRPAEGHEFKLIDEDGRELPPGPDTVGELVGRSAVMMSGYHRRPEATREAEWFDAQGRRFLRSGDIGRFDADGFLQLLDRRKDLIISGGFNLYPSDLEAVLRQHPAVADCAVVGVASATWGETPVAFVVRRAGHAESEDALRDWFAARVGKTQRLAGLRFVAELPRSAIGKVLRRELREAWGQGSS